MGFNTTTIKTSKSIMDVTNQSKLEFIIKSFLLDPQLSKILSVNDVWELMYDGEYRTNILFLNKEPICCIGENIDYKNFGTFINKILIKKFAEKLI